MATRLYNLRRNFDLNTATAYFCNFVQYHNDLDNDNDNDILFVPFYKALQKTVT